MSALVFMDTETTGLSLDADIWEFAAVRREANGDERELHLFIEHDAAKCAHLPGTFLTDHMHRFPPSHGGVQWGAGVTRRDRAARAIVNFFAVGSGEPKPHVIGAVPNFDTERISRMLPDYERDPWHYHLIDVENLAVGFLHGFHDDMCTHEHAPLSLPWDSNALSLAVGVDPEQFERHTAMGDVRWAMAIYDAITWAVRVTVPLSTPAPADTPAVGAGQPDPAGRGEAATAAGAPAGLGLRFIAHGLPKPKGSLRHVGRGRMVEQVNGATWHDTILWAAVQAMRTPDPLTGPLRVEATFTFPKPKSAPKTRRIWPVTRATGDLDKQLRRLFDSMQAAGAFGDDSQIVEVAAAKRYVNEGDAALTFPGVVVRITPLPPETTESG